MWVDRLVEATGWLREPEEIDWGPVQQELGTGLPEDFKRLCEVFGPGSFSAYLFLRWPYDGGAWGTLAGTWRSYQQMLMTTTPNMADYFSPYGLYGLSEPGLIEWGGDQGEGRYYWLADSSVNPVRWTVIARRDGLEPWHRYDMSTSEVIYRVIADVDFKPFSTAQPGQRAFYLPDSLDIDIAEAWETFSVPSQERPSS